MINVVTYLINATYLVVLRMSEMILYLAKHLNDSNEKRLHLWFQLENVTNPLVPKNR